MEEPDAALQEVVWSSCPACRSGRRSSCPVAAPWPRPASPGRSDWRDVRTNLDDPPEALVADDQVVLPSGALPNAASMISRSVPSTPTRMTRTRTPRPSGMSSTDGRGTSRRWSESALARTDRDVPASILGRGVVTVAAGGPGRGPGRRRCRRAGSAGRAGRPGPGSTSRRSMPSRITTPAASSVRWVADRVAERGDRTGSRFRRAACRVRQVARRPPRRAR